MCLEWKICCTPWYFAWCEQVVWDVTWYIGSKLFGVTFRKINNLDICCCHNVRCYKVIYIIHTNKHRHVYYTCMLSSEKSWGMFRLERGPYWYLVKSQILHSSSSSFIIFHKSIIVYRHHCMWNLSWWCIQYS